MRLTHLRLANLTKVCLGSSGGAFRRPGQGYLARPAEIDFRREARVIKDPAIERWNAYRETERPFKWTRHTIYNATMYILVVPGILFYIAHTSLKEKTKEYGWMESGTWPLDPYEPRPYVAVPPPKDGIPIPKLAPQRLGAFSGNLTWEEWKKENVK